MQKPDFVKLELFFTENYERRINDQSTWGARGLSPEMTAELVKRAQSSNETSSVTNEIRSRSAIYGTIGGDMVSPTPGEADEHARPDRLLSDHQRSSLQ